MIVLDAGVLVAHLDERDAHHSEALEQLVAVAGEPFACSPITRAEVLVGPARIGRVDDAVTALATLGVDDVALTPDAPLRLATLRADTKLKLPDCCVLLAAQDAAASRILTFDDRLAREAARFGFG